VLYNLEKDRMWMTTREMDRDKQNKRERRIWYREGITRHCTYPTRLPLPILDTYFTIH